MTPAELALVCDAVAAAATAAAAVLRGAQAAPGPSSAAHRPTLIEVFDQDNPPGSGAAGWDGMAETDRAAHAMSFRPPGTRPASRELVDAAEAVVKILSENPSHPTVLQHLRATNCDMQCDRSSGGMPLVCPQLPNCARALGGKLEGDYPDMMDEGDEENGDEEGEES